MEEIKLLIINKLKEIPSFSDNKENKAKSVCRYFKNKNQCQEMLEWLNNTDLEQLNFTLVCEKAEIIAEERFNFEKWDSKVLMTKEEAREQFVNNSIINDEIEEIIILDRDTHSSSEYYLATTYINEVLRGENGKFDKEVVANFYKTYKEVTLDMFPKDFKYMCPSFSKKPLLLKLKSGKQLELFFEEHYDYEKEEVFRRLYFSINKMLDFPEDRTPIMNYNKLYNMILNKKIIDINFDTARYINRLGNKLDGHNKINQINIEFENGYVMEMVRAGYTGYFIAIWDINKQTYDNFSIRDFVNNFLGNVEDINKV